MLIIAGSLYVDPSDRERYLDLNGDVAVTARDSPGCLDFVQAADPIDASRINVYERWEDAESLMAFRGAGAPDAGAPPIRSADVKRYVIASVEDP